jgi:hypothetical protein
MSNFRTNCWIWLFNPMWFGSTLLKPLWRHIVTSIWITRSIFHHWPSLWPRVPGYRSRGPSSNPGTTRFFWEVGSLERGPLSLLSTIKEVLKRKISVSGLENRDYSRRRSAALSTRHPSICKKLVLPSPTRGGRSVSIVRSRTQATELVSFLFYFPPPETCVKQHELLRLHHTSTYASHEIP